MFSNIRLTLYTPWEDLDYWSRSFLFVFSYNHTEGSNKQGDKMTLCNFKIARNDKFFIYRFLISKKKQTSTF